MKKFKCSMNKKIESLAKNKRSEKRTIQPPSYDVYSYDELSDEAKKTAKDAVKEEILRIRSDDYSTFSDSCVTCLDELFPNSDLKVQYSLSYSQGDGFNTYGKLRVDDLLNADVSKYPLTGSNIKPLSDKDAIKAVCDKADIYDIDLAYNNRYGYSLADRLEVVPDYDVELTDDEIGLLNELETYARDVMGHIDSQFGDDGYDWFYEVSDDDIKDEIEWREYEFTEDGNIA